MPTYEYECPQCGIFELFQTITAAPLKRCPTCRRKVRRLIGAGGGLLFKGSGFYITDYRSEEYKQKAKSDQKSSESSKPESKPDKSAQSKKPSKSDSSAAPKT
ncbi:MAG TPA: zinc ribbon domain-containing protein [Firmicutes bacterium]|nr:zinc ribbon domain-containing protein [Bacillota bacterium]